MSLNEIIPTAGRYAVLIAILVILRQFAYSDSLKFIIYICMLITTFFTIGFLYWDLLGSGLLSRGLFSENSENIGETGGLFQKIFVAVLFLTLLLQIASLSIIIAVFDYGKEQVSSYYTPRLTKHNRDLLRDYNDKLESFFEVVWFCSAVLAISQIKDEQIKTVAVTLACAIPILYMLYTSIWGTIRAVEFLKNKQGKRALYETQE